MWGWTLCDFSARSLEDGTMGSKRGAVLACWGFMVMAVHGISAYGDESIRYKSQEIQRLVVARQEIEYLRRWYARATDLIGEKTSETTAESHGIYLRIFTHDATMSMSIDGVEQRCAQGPEAWFGVVRSALAKYKSTQHLLGTQLVEFHELTENDTGQLISGDASMSSYVHAWHLNTDNTARVVLGIYKDRVRFSKESGWQIYDMELVHLMSEQRKMGN